MRALLFSFIFSIGVHVSGAVLLWKLDLFRFDAFEPARFSMESSEASSGSDGVEVEVEMVEPGELAENQSLLAVEPRTQPVQPVERPEEEAVPLPRADSKDDFPLPLPPSIPPTLARETPLEDPPLQPVELPSRPDSAPPQPAYLASEDGAFTQASADSIPNERPRYPPIAEQRRWEGTVYVEVEVLQDGRAGQVSVVQGSGHSVLDEAAASKLREWRFVPAKELGVPTRSFVKIPVTFQLKKL